MSGNKPDLRVLSLGAGVQSSTVLLMMCKGELEPVDCAIFADTQWEPRAVYDWLENTLRPEAEKAGIPLHIVTTGNIREDTLATRRSASLPLFMENPDGSQGLLWRQCTYDYKIVPIRRKMKEMGTKGRNTQIELQIGISIDEVHRMKPSNVPNIYHRYPLIEDTKTDRLGCMRWLKNNDYELPHRSACIGCPYHSNEHWAYMKEQEPDNWIDAVKFDAAIRNGVPGTKMTSKAYLHRQLLPLDEVYLGEDQYDLWAGECEGMCGV